MAHVSNKITVRLTGLTRMQKQSLSVSVKRELAAHENEENYVCSGVFAKFLCEHQYADSDAVIDTAYLTEMLSILA